MDIYDIGLWAGTEASLHQYMEALKRVEAMDASMRSDAFEARQAEQATPRLFSRQGSIGVVAVHGSLNNSGSWQNEYLGASGYPEIREALIYAASHADISEIVLDIKSGGGAVSGVADTASLINTIDTRVKPVKAYSDGMVASAAYWLGCSARSIHIGTVTEAGSIGVLVVHMERSKMAAEMGITVNVIRSGKYKALGNGMEPLSELGKEVLQAQVDQICDMFYSHVAQARGTTIEVVSQKMGQGRTFIGQGAVAVGLVDGVTNFDAFMSTVQGGIDSKKQQPKYGAHSPKGPQVKIKNALTEQQIAAMASGVVVAEGAVEDAAALEVVEEVVEETVVDPAAEADKDKPVEQEAVAPDAVVLMLQGQLAAAQDQVIDLKVEAKANKVAADAALSAAEKMRPIVRAAVGNLRVAMGGVAAGVDELGDEALMAEHANLAAQFTSKFKAGGVAAVSSTPAAGKGGEVASVDPKRQARLASTRHGK